MFSWLRVERRSLRGHSYWVYERIMPRIKPGLENCIVYLYPAEHDARLGAPKGGTAFFVSMPYADLEHGPTHLYLVTAAHVLRHGATIARINTKDDGTEIFSLSQDNWVFHSDGDDVAVCPLDPPPDCLIDAIPRAWFIVRPDQPGGHDRVGLGDDVFFIGRFTAYEDMRQNHPTVRFGNVAALPKEPIKSEFGIMQESFLVEARSLSGYSGSPVFVMGLPYLASMGMGSPMGAAVFMGLDWCHLRTFEPVRGEDKELLPEKLFVAMNLGMMGVIPAWKIADILDSKELDDIRKKRE